MRTAAAEESLISREELDALLEEMPKVWSAGGGPSGSVREDVADIELQRANESFAFEQGLMLYYALLKEEMRELLGLSNFSRDRTPVPPAPDRPRWW